jgi:uncharacterized protein YkwD
LVFLVVLGGFGLVGLAIYQNSRLEEVQRADRKPQAERKDPAPFPARAAETERKEQAPRSGVVEEEIEPTKTSRLKPVPEVPDDEPQQQPKSISRPEEDHAQQPKVGHEPDAPGPDPRLRPPTKVEPKVEDRAEAKAKLPDKNEPAKSAEELEKVIFDLTNKARAKEKLPALRLNSVLTKAARAHSANQSRQEKMAHELDGKNPAQRIRESGYRAARGGENVASHTPGDMPEVIFDGWMNSPGHRANILSAGFTEIGIGVARSAKGNVYYTQVFGAPADDKSQQ